MKRPIMSWLTEDRALWIALALFLLAIVFAWFTSPVVAAIREALA